jgi:glycosyltransferase involved in cell wall biosynthesis
MRILIINSEYPPIGGGAGNASAHLAHQFTESGHRVVVLTAHYTNLPHKSIIDEVSVIRVKSLRKRRDRSGALEQIAFMGMGGIASIALIRRWRPDIILAFFGVPSGAVACMVKALSGIPYVVSLRGGDVPGFRPYDFAVYHRFLSPLLRLVWKQAAAVVANSQGLLSLAEDFYREVDIQIIPNGVDISQFNQSENRDWENAHILWVGRLVYQKGLDILLDALEQLKDQSWQLTLVGDGPQRVLLEELAQEKGIANRIIFTGWLDRKDLYRYYCESNMFVFPSRHEGMPNSVLEAMASGLPVIASKIAGNEELILPGISGMLVPPGDHNQLASALRNLIADSTLRLQMGAEARKRVVSRFTWEETAQQYLSLMEEILQ